MAIHQFTSIARHGDAIFDYACQLRRVFLDWGVKSNIYVLDSDLADFEGVYNYKKLRSSENDILIYQFGIGSKLTDFLIRRPGRKFLMYHNMTPDKYLLGVDNRSYLYVRWGRAELDRLKDHLTGVFAASRFNAIDLEENHGYGNVTIIPVLRDFSAWEGKEPDPGRLEKWKSDKKTILFIGRVMANKRQDDLIKVLAAYTKMYGPNARLVMPGSWNNSEPFRDHLLNLADMMDLNDLVELPGFIDDDDFHALFSLADVYLSMSEHEGFGVPLLEAMYFKVPAVAYSVCSIPEVLGGAGVKLNKKDPVVTAAVLHELFENNELRGRIIGRQNERLKDFSRQAVEPALRSALAPYL